MPPVAETSEVPESSAETATDERGCYEVRDARTGAVHRFDEREFFLLSRLDGEESAADVCRTYEARFGEPLSEGALRDFLNLGWAQGFVPGSADGFENPLVVRGDDGARDGRGRQRALDDVQDHRAACDFQKRFSGQTARRVARGDDCDDRWIL